MEREGQLSAAAALNRMIGGGVDGWKRVKIGNGSY